MTTKWLVSILVMFAIAAGGWWYFMSGSSAPSMQDTNATMTNTGQQSDATQSVGASGTSNADLQADLNTIDTQVQAAGDANTSASSFTDTPVQQTE